VKDVGQKRAQFEDAIRSYSCSVRCIKRRQQYEHTKGKGKSNVLPRADQEDPDGE
jgi:hypothetical protein